jgi:hypothetical protein
VQAMGMDSDRMDDSRLSAVVGRPRQRPHIESEPLDDDAVLIDLVSGDYHVLNRTGFAIWELCDGTHSIDELAEIIADVYSIDYDRAVDDVTSLIERLRGADLIELD